MEEEIEVCKAIYGDEAVRVLGKSLMEVEVGRREEGLREERKKVIVRFEYPETGYPETRGPGVRLFDDDRLSKLTKEKRKELEQEMMELWVPGEVVAFTILEWLRDNDDVWPEGEEEDDEIEGSQVDDGRGTATMHIVTGEPICDRKSTFQAHVARVLNTSDVDLMLKQLLDVRKVKSATHNVMAYRIVAEPSTASFLQDCDDDGESAAGGRLLHLLQVAGVENVCVVVSRWFGGIHLGPDRFKHINNAARILLEREGLIQKKK